MKITPETVTTVYREALEEIGTTEFVKFLEMILEYNERDVAVNTLVCVLSGPKATAEWLAGMMWIGYKLGLAERDLELLEKQK